jgi:hypothetical protein
MTNLVQDRGWGSGIRLRAASAALTFAVVLAPAVVAGPSAQAQTFKVTSTVQPAPAVLPGRIAAQATPAAWYSSWLGTTRRPCSSASPAGPTGNSLRACHKRC